MQNNLIFNKKLVLFFEMFFLTFFQFIFFFFYHINNITNFLIITISVLITAILSSFIFLGIKSLITKNWIDLIIYLIFSFIFPLINIEIIGKLNLNSSLNQTQLEIFYFGLFTVTFFGGILSRILYFSGKYIFKKLKY